MKKILLIIVLLAVVGGGTFWFKKHGASADGDAKPAGEKAAHDDNAGVKISRDDKGNVVITMNEETQGDNGIKVARAEAAQFAREVKGYGHVLDPAPLAALLTELATAQAAYAASSNELARVKILSGQGNASTRALQTAEAAASRDRSAVQSVNERLLLGWGKPITDQGDPATFLESLTSRQKALVRVDLPGGETLPGPPTGARIVSLSGNSAEGAFLGAAPNVDPQTQGRGYIFFIETNAAAFAPGETVSGFISTGTEPLQGTIVPRDAVVRTEGSGWVYVRQGKAEDFVRVPVALDRPAENGWFVTKGVTASNYVVVTGAQMLLSEELKGSAKPPD